MIKFIKTEGKTAQEVQNYIDSCVNNGANPYACVSGASQEHNYDLELSIENFKYGGVDVDGDTLLSNDLRSFLEFDIENLLEIKKCAEKICNAVFETGDHDEIEKQAIEIRSLLS